MGLASLPDRTTAALQPAPIWPSGVLFHREPVPRRIDRGAWATRKRNALAAANIVFLDPDNGTGDETERHATFSGIRWLREPSRALVFITFPGRSAKHDVLLS